MDRITTITKAICESRKFECGEGACSLLCLDQLGDVRAKGCTHHQRIHADLAKRIDAALADTEAHHG